MRIIFAGSPQFAADILQALLNTEHDICAVYTQPDRPSGRGRKQTANPVAQLATEQHLITHQPLHLKDPTEQIRLAEYNADVMVVAAYGLLLPQVILDTPRHGCLNIHASLLPRWRGASPIQSAILNGDTDTGVTIMQMAIGLDTGDMLHKLSCPITAQDTSASLHDTLTALGIKALLSTLDNLQTINPETQDESLVTYAAKIQKQMANIDWQQSALHISRTVRAYNPWPIVFSQLSQENIRIWEAEVLNEHSIEKPGTIIRAEKNHLDVATGENILRILRLQFPGKKPLAIAELLHAKHHILTVGNSFTS